MGVWSQEKKNFAAGRAGGGCGAWRGPGFRSKREYGLMYGLIYPPYPPQNVVKAKAPSGSGHKKKEFCKGEGRGRLFERFRSFPLRLVRSQILQIRFRSYSTQILLIFGLYLVRPRSCSFRFRSYSIQILPIQIQMLPDVDIANLDSDLSHLISPIQLFPHLYLPQFIY